jgi:endonuclease-3
MRKLIKKITSFLEQRYKLEPWYKDPFKVLIGCVLSQRTREENTDAACQALFAIATTPEEILALPLPKLESLIKRAGFFRQKAKNIRKICQVLLQEYKGAVPSKRSELLKLPGVGPKTAAVTLCYGYGQPTIAVDVHCARIAKRLGLVPGQADVEQIRKRLEALFPSEQHYLINRGFVLFGREICTPRNPRCGMCELQDICAYRVSRHA